MNIFEYHVTHWPLPGPEGDLAQLGKEGWELVAVAVGKEGYPHGYFYFRRIAKRESTTHGRVYGENNELLAEF